MNRICSETRETQASKKSSQPPRSLESTMKDFNWINNRLSGSTQYGISSGPSQEGGKRSNRASLGKKGKEISRINLSRPSGCWEQISKVSTKTPEHVEMKTSPKRPQRGTASIKLKELELLRAASELRTNKVNPYQIKFRRTLSNRLDFQLAAKILGEKRPVEASGSSKSLYRTETLIGSGNFGQVYSAVQLGTNLSVALKVIPLNAAQSIHTKLRDELRTLKELAGHPSIVRLFEYFHDEENFYCVFEHLPNLDLKQFIENRAPLDDSELALIARKVLEGLEFIHSKDFVHRDIKAENILLDKNLQPKIADFGLSNYLGDFSFEKDTAGTPTHLAPEVFLKEYQISRKTDIWSFGVMLYQLRFGVLPFEGEDYEELYRNILSTRIPLCEQGNARHPFSDLMRHLFQRNQHERFGTSEALSHPWIESSEKLISLNENFEEENCVNAIELRYAVLEILGKLGFSLEFIVRSIRDGLFNYCSACYWNLIADNEPQLAF